MITTKEKISFSIAMIPILCYLFLYNRLPDQLVPLLFTSNQGVYYEKLSILTFFIVFMSFIVSCIFSINKRWLYKFIGTSDKMPVDKWMKYMDYFQLILCSFFTIFSSTFLFIQL